MKRIHLVQPGELLEQETILVVPLTKAWSESAREAALAARKAASDASKAGQNPKQAAAIAKKLVQEKGMDRAKAVERTAEIMSQQKGGGGESDSVGGKGGEWKSESESHSEEDYKSANTTDRRGDIAQTEGDAIFAMHSNYEDAMGGTNLPEAKDPEANDRMEEAFTQAGLRDGDQGYGEGNLHMWSPEEGGRGFGVSSITGKVYDTKGGREIGQMRGKPETWASQLRAFSRPVSTK